MKVIFAIIFILIVSPPVYCANLLPNTTTIIPSDTLSNELASNNTFSSDSVWTKGAGWTIGAGVATATSVASSQTVNQNVGTKGAIHRVVFDVLTSTAGAFAARAGGTTGTAVNTAGTHTQDVLAIVSGSVGVQAVGTTSGTIDNVFIKLIQNAIGTQSFYSSGFIQNLPGTLSGDTAGVWSIVSGPDANGKAYQIANTGSTDVVVTLTPTKALTVGRHYRPIVIAKRTVGSGTATYKLTGGTAVNITSATFVPLAALAIATNTTDKPTFTVPAGTTIQFYQPKLMDNTDSGGFNFGNFNLRY